MEGQQGHHNNNLGDNNNNNNNQKSADHGEQHQPKDRQHHRSQPSSYSSHTSHSIPGTQNLVSFLDKRLLVYLRDGRNLFGILRSFDQFGNLILHDTIERYYVDLEWADEPHGVYLVRGENVVLLGDLDEEEFRQTAKRMAKFRRPLGDILPRVRQIRSHETRLRHQAPPSSEMQDFDFY